jgi:hypothetical protein
MNMKIYRDIEMKGTSIPVWYAGQNLLPLLLSFLQLTMFAEYAGSLIWCIVQLFVPF